VATRDVWQVEQAACLVTSLPRSTGSGRYHPGLFLERTTQLSLDIKLEVVLVAHAQHRQQEVIQPILDASQHRTQRLTIHATAELTDVREVRVVQHTDHRR